MRHLAGTPLQTRGFAAFLTWKQAEMLLLLRDGAKPVAEISDIAQELLNIDVAEGTRPMYFGVDDQGIRSCLSGLERRRLVRQYPNGNFGLTDTGREAAGGLR